MSKAPSKEQWEKLYAISNEIKKLEPWNFLYDMDIITIKLVGREEPLFCSIMGSLGECFAISVYRDYSERAGLIKLSNSNSLPPSIIMSYQNCLTCYFGNRNEIENEDMQVIRDLGLKFRGKNNWIYFRNHKAGYCAWFIDDEECELLIDVFQNLFMSILAMDKGLIVDFDSGETLLREFSKKRNEWINYAASIPEIPYVYDEIEIKDELLIKKMKSKKKTATEIECELFFPFFPIQESKVQRPYFPEMFVVADVNTEMIIYHEAVQPEDNKIQIVLDILIEYIMKNGRPKTIFVRDEKMAGIIADLCEKIDIKLVKLLNLPLIDDFILSMEDMNPTM